MSNPSLLLPTKSPLLPRLLEESEASSEKTMNISVIPRLPKAEDSQTPVAAFVCKVLNNNNSNNASSSSPTQAPEASSPASIHSTNSSDATKRRKRVVQFEQDPDCSQCSVKRRVVELRDVPPSSQMSDEEKRRQFMQSEDRQEICEGVELVVHACLSQDAANADDPSSAYAVYAETLAATYSMCHNTAMLGEYDNVEDELPLNEMTCLGVHHAEARGLETRIIPGFAEDRLLKRRELVHGVLDVQNELRQQGKTVDEIHDDLGMVSEYLSKPAKQFARALGVVDGTSALLEYAQDEAAQEHRAQQGGGASMPGPDAKGMFTSSVLLDYTPKDAAPEQETGAVTLSDDQKQLFSSPVA